MFRHGLSKHPLYETFRNMVRRCTVPTFASYQYYGARGIQVEWESFLEFYHDMANSYRPGLQIDRIDVNGNYCKSNCRWATPLEQTHNRRPRPTVKATAEAETFIQVANFTEIDEFDVDEKNKSKHLTYDGETKTIVEWAQGLGVSAQTLRIRRCRGWSVPRTLETPIKNSEINRIKGILSWQSRTTRTTKAKIRTKN